MRGFAGTCLLTAARFQPPAPVPPENSIVPLTARITCAAGAVMVGWPGAAQDRLPADALVIQPGCPDRPRGRGEGRRAAGTPARERGAAPERRPVTVGPSRPGLVHHAHAVDPAPPLGRGLPGHARDAAGPAPPARRQEIRHRQTTPTRPPGDGPEHRPAHHPPVKRNPLWGYRRIHGELTKLGGTVAASTV